LPVSRNETEPCPPSLVSRPVVWAATTPEPLESAKSPEPHTMKKSKPSFLFEAALDPGALLVIGSFLVWVSRAPLFI
jgi:hypothetical protein